jgi:hypothetical protein
MAGRAVKQSTWWIWSLLFGVAVAGGVGWYVFVEKNYELELARFLSARPPMSDRAKAAAGTIAEDAAPAPEPPKEPDAPTTPLSARNLSYANRLAATIRADADGKTTAHQRNREILTYLEGWYRMNAGLDAVTEALGTSRMPSDTRPETYLDAWDTVTTALTDGHLDIPAGLSDEDYTRFRTAVRAHWLASQQSDLAGALKLVFTERDGKQLLASADEQVLANIGVSLTDTPWPADKAPDFTKLVRGVELSRAQRDFLATRLTVLSTTEGTAMAIAHRFSELDMPEYAWKFLTLLLRDVKIGGTPMTMRGLSGRVLTARRHHLEALAAYTNDAGSKDKLAVLERTRTAYKAELDNLSTELQSAATRARAIMTPDKGGLTRIERLRSVNHERQGLLSGEMANFAEFDPVLYREKISKLFDTDEQRDGAVEEEAARVKRTQDLLVNRRKTRLDDVEIALNSLAKFGDELRMSAGLENGSDAVTQMGLSPRDIENALNSSELLRPLLTSVKSGGDQKAYDEYLGSLRRVLLTDVAVLKARISRELGRGAESRESLARIASDFGRVRNALVAMYPDRTLPARRRIDEVTRDAKNAKMLPPDDVQLNYLFIEAMSADFDALARSSAVAAPETRNAQHQFALELNQLRMSMLDANFEAAQYSYQLLLNQLAKLTGNERPTVTYAAADALRREYAKFENALRDKADGRTTESPVHPLDRVDFGRDLGKASAREMAELRRYMDMEMEYRRLRDDAVAAFRQFATVDHPLLRSQASFAIASIMLDDVEYQHDWKWRNGHAPDPLASVESNRNTMYGIYSFVDDVPLFNEMSAAPTAHPYGGRWLGYEETLRHHRGGPAVTKVRELSATLKSLREVAPGADPHLYTAIRIRSGQLLEFLPPASARPVDAPDGSGELTRYTDLYPGDLASAVAQYYVPLLKDHDAVTDDVLIRNRYIPLSVLFNRVTNTLNRWMEQVDMGSAPAISTLFSVLALPKDGRAPEEPEIAGFWRAFFSANAERTAGMMELPDRLYEFNARLAALADQRANLLLERSTENSPALRRMASEAQARSRTLYRDAGRTLWDFAAAYPSAPGEARRLIRTGDAFFKSGDYVFAIDAYRRYYEKRGLSDRRNERAEIFHVVQRIGESWMALGIYEGQARRAAETANDKDALMRETAWQTMTLDGAMQAFSWNIQRIRELMLSPGAAGEPQKRLPPEGALSFISMAQAQVRLGQLRAAQGDASGTRLLNDAITLLRSDLIESRLFPALVPGFVDSVLYRDAQFQIGTAELELARAERSKTAKTIDNAVLYEHLRRAALAFDDITGRWDQPENRSLYLRSLEKGSSYADAVRELGGGEKFSDDIFYLTIMRRAETDWMRAVHSPDPLSETVILPLIAAEGRLEGLVRRLNDLNGRDTPVANTTLGFPDLARQARTLYGDVLYLHARTLRDRLAGGGANQFEVQKLYQQAIDAYMDARKASPNHFLSAWAYAQELNCHRALAKWDTSEVAEEKLMLAKAPSYLASLTDEAFASAPDDMTRQAWTKHFAWYSQLGSASN